MLYIQYQGVWLVFTTTYMYVHVCFIEIPVYNANRVDPAQTPHSATFDLVYTDPLLIFEGVPN